MKNLLTIVWLMLAMAGLADAEPRTALVIGCDYQGTGLQLPSPVQDAKAIAQALEQAGFAKDDVTLLRNPDRKKMLEGIEAFGAALARRGGVGFFYFSGHGCQHEGENFLLPMGANVTYREDLPTEAVSAQRVVVRMEAAKNGVNLLFLDACRTNELPSATKKSALAKGLATMTGSNILIGFAAKENTPSFDSGSGSYYTLALTKYLPLAGANVFSMLTKVRQEVKHATGDQQEPFLYAGLDEEFSFVPVSGRSEVADASSPSQISSMPPVTRETPRSPKDLPASGYFDLESVFFGTKYTGFNRYSKNKILGKAQEKLKEAGLYHGPVDGAMGKGSEEGIVQWQRQHGLEVTGRIDGPTISSIGIGGIAESQPPPEPTPPEPKTKTKTPSPSSPQYPEGKLVPGVDGYITSPYGGSKRYDRRFIVPGTKFWDSSAHKFFIVPYLH